MRKWTTPERPETTVELVGPIADDLPEYAACRAADGSEASAATGTMSRSNPWATGSHDQYW
jgi:hypothetical protein